MSAGRPPFDEIDRAQVEAYLTRTGRLLVDPLGKDADPNDAFFAPSLGAARMQMAEAFGTVRPDGSRFRVYPVFVERSFPNAFAKDLGGLHICAINTGLATVAFELAAFTLSQGDTFTDVGDPSVETAPEVPEGAQLGFWISDRVREAGDARTAPVGEDLIPLDPERRLMAHFLAQMMLRFAWFHELFHCLNGHCGLKRAHDPEGLLHEMPDDPEFAMGRVETATEIAGIPTSSANHAFEFDADRSALWAMLQVQLREEEPFEVLAEYPRGLRLRLTIFAAFLMVFLFEQSERRQVQFPDGSHPAPRLRLHDLVRTLASNAGEGIDDVGQAFQWVLSDTDTLAKRIPAFVTAKQVRDELTSGAYQNVLEQAKIDLFTVRSRLYPFDYQQSVMSA